MTSSHSFHSLEAEKGPISFTFGHTHTGMVDTKSPPRGQVVGNHIHVLWVQASKVYKAGRAFTKENQCKTLA